MGGARWAGSSQLVAFEAFPTALGEGQPGEVVGSRPGRGGGRGPAFPEQRRRLHQHVVHSCKHSTRWARHPRWQVSHCVRLRPTQSHPQRDPLGVSGCWVGKSAGPSCGSGLAPPVTSLPAGPHRGPELSRGRGHGGGRAACASRCGHLGTLLRRGARGVVPPPGQAGSPTPSRSGHASPPCKCRSGRKERSGGEPPRRRAHPRRPSQAGTEGQRGALPSARFHSRVRGCHRTEALARKCPAGSPLLGGWGRVGWGGVGSGPRAATPRSAALGRPASACPALGSNFRSSSRGPRGHAHWRARAPRPGRPLWPPGLVRRPTDEPTASAPVLGHAPSSAAGARPLYPDDARSGIPAPSARAVPRGRRRL